MPGNAPADVVVTEDVWGPAFDRLAAEFAVSRHSELPGDLRGVRALVVRNRTTVDAAVLEAAADLRVVGRAGVGLDNIDLVSAGARGVVVVSPMGANALSVAEHAIGLAISLARGIVRGDRAVRRGEWQRTPGFELRGRTWGVVGAGATGREVARLARLLGMETIGYDPYATVDELPLVPIEEVMAAADVVSIHLPSTVETRGIVDAGLLASMRSGSLLINVGRGEVVDEEALISALKKGIPAGAALDVRANEPPQPGELEQLDNVILTPHVAGITVESQARIGEVLARDIRAVLTGGVARSAVRL